MNARIEQIRNKILSLAGALRGRFSLSEKRAMAIITAVIIVLVNLISLKLNFRLDLTGNSAYSLSPMSAGVVSSLESPLTVRVYFTKDLPAPYNSVKRYLDDLLEEYSSRGRGNFRFVYIDPSLEKNKKELSDYGIHAVKVSEYKSDQISVREAFMALAIEHEDLLERIDALTGVDGMEYRITSIIKKMTGKVDALHRLKNPINVTLFASKNSPDYEKVVGKVREQFEKCNGKNYGKLQFRGPLDPLADADAMNLAKMYGIPKLVLREMSGREHEIMLGLAVENSGRFETVHLLGRSFFSMYSVIDSLDEIINGIVGSIIGVNQVVGYVTGHDELSFSDPQEGAVNFRPQIPDMYDFQQIDLSREDIPDSIRAIVINGPKREFSDAELFRLDQFVMRGGSLVLFLDAFRESPQQFPAMMQRSPSVIPNETGLEPLLAHYGVSVDPKIVMDMNCLQYRGEMLYMVPQIGEKGLGRDSDITRHLKRVYFVKASPLAVDGAKTGAAGIEKKTLVTSSRDSWLVTSITPWAMYPPEEHERSSYDLAVMLSGRFSSYFSGKPLPKFEPDARAGQGAAGAKISVPSFVERGVKAGKVIVVGSSEITRFDYQGDQRGLARPNAVFVQNIIDYVNGNYDMPEMRSKGLEMNPLHEDNPLANLIRSMFNIPLADAVNWARIVLKVWNILVIPAVVVMVSAGGMYAWRRKRKAMIERKFHDGGEVS